MQQEKNRDIYIIGGTILTLTFFMPVIDCLGNFIMSMFNKCVNKWQIEREVAIAKAQEEIELQPPVHAIGFEIPNEETYEDFENE